MKEDLPCGMTKMPFGSRGYDFFSFAVYAIGKDEIVEQYKMETGVDLRKLVPKTVLDKMIDGATGYSNETMSKFLDWLVVNHWGEEKEDVPAIHISVKKRDAPPS